MDLTRRLRRKNEFDANLAIGARQFNLATGRDRHLRQRAQRQDRFTDPATGLLREELGVSRVCPVCEGREHKPFLTKAGFRYVKCSSCGMVYVNPVLKKESAHLFYENEDSYTQVLLNDLQLSLDRKKFQYGLDLLEEYLPRKGKMLDVGCGPGVFLEEAKKRDWLVQGVEFNKRCVQRLKEMKIETASLPLEEANFSADTFQCVSLWTVLEHIVEPRPFLRIIHNILAPGGLILIFVPNIDSLALRILQEKSACFAGESHVNFFSAATLSRLLKETGFEVVECESALTELGAVNNYLNFEDPYFGEAKQALDFLTPDYIHERMLGYCLLSLARVGK